jgi:hypothetical protein
MIMSFEEKSTWVMLFSVLAVYSWYFLKLSAALPEEGVTTPEIAYKGMMLATVCALIVIAAVAHAVIASNGSDQSDERDHKINRFGEYVGGYVATAAALSGMGMAMFELAHFWIANTILLLLVLAELISGGIKIYCYRRGC